MTDGDDDDNAINVFTSILFSAVSGRGTVTYMAGSNVVEVLPHPSTGHVTTFGKERVHRKKYGQQQGRYNTTARGECSSAHDYKKGGDLDNIYTQNISSSHTPKNKGTSYAWRCSTPKVQGLQRRCSIVRTCGISAQATYGGVFVVGSPKHGNTTDSQHPATIPA